MPGTNIYFRWLSIKKILFNNKKKYILFTCIRSFIVLVFYFIYCLFVFNI